MRLVAVLAILLFGLAPAVAANRFAFVVGNDAYVEVKGLKKAVNDARAVTEALTGLGFTVDTIENATRNQMSRKLVEFEAKIQPGDTALFFFAGHGFEIRGDNYLLPVDVPGAEAGEEGLVRDASFAAADIIDRIQAKGPATVIAIFDACRNNPFDRPGTRAFGGDTRGLARMAPPEGVFILFSAGAKQEALDSLGTGDPDANSVFTRTLVKSLATPGLSLIQIAKETQSKVKALAATVSHDQTPAYYDQIIGDYYLRPLKPGEKPPAAPDDSALAAEVAAWKAVSNSTNPDDLRAFIAHFGARGLFVAEAEEKLAALTPPDKLDPAEIAARIDAGMKLTAQPGDPAYAPAYTPVAADRFDPAAAEAACKAARAGAPQDARVAFGLGRALDKEDRFTEALALFEEAANRGSAAAANHAGAIYYAGDGVTIDYARARIYFQKALAGGYFGNALRYAQMLEGGLGGPADPALAISALERAANAKVAEAAFDLGVRYDQAIGVRRDPKAARGYYREAIDNGFPAASFMLGVLIGTGQGGPVDRKQAAELLLQSFSLEGQAAPNDDMRGFLRKFDKRVVIELERLIASYGEDPGKIDGRMDDKAFAALDAAAAKLRRSAGVAPSP
ncbi:MAG: caspase family protein [Bauldia sp.]